MTTREKAYVEQLIQDMEQLTQQLKELLDATPRAEKKVNYEDIISELLIDLGIPQNLLGYRYIRTGLMLVLEDSKKIRGVVKQLYPEIGKMYNTTSSKVERAIRHAIEIAWTRGNIQMQEKLFGHSTNKSKGKPTNTEFLATIADYIRRKY